MAIIICEECKKEHSDTIEACPHCGYRRQGSSGNKSKQNIAPKKKASFGNKVMSFIGYSTLIVFLLVIIVYIFSEPDKTETNEIWYVHSSVNIRTGPSTDNEIIKTLTPGSKVAVIEKGDEWWKVKTSEIDSGYVHKSLLKQNPQEERTNNVNIAKDESLSYSIYKEDISDIPAKTQVSIDILIEDKQFSEKQITNLLNQLYNKTITRSGFKYHKNPTNVFIYAYTSKEKANSGMGQWVGMIQKGFNDKTPTISISERQFNSMAETQDEKWNLTYQQRKDIWIKLISAEDRALKEAEKKYPTDKPGITNEELIKSTDYKNELETKYKLNVINEYGVKKNIIDSIVYEGIKMGWAFPK